MMRNSFWGGVVGGLLGIWSLAGGFYLHETLMPRTIEPEKVEAVVSAAKLEAEVTAEEKAALKAAEVKRIDRMAAFGMSCVADGGSLITGPGSGESPETLACLLTKGEHPKWKRAP